MIRFMFRIIAAVVLLAALAFMIPFLLLRSLIFFIFMFGAFRLLFGGRRRRYERMRARMVPVRQKYYDVEDAEVISIK